MRVQTLLERPTHQDVVVLPFFFERVWKQVLVNCEISLLLMNRSFLLLRIVHNKTCALYFEHALHEGGPQLGRCADCDKQATFSGLIREGTCFRRVLVEIEHSLASKQLHIIRTMINHRLVSSRDCTESCQSSRYHL